MQVFNLIDSVIIVLGLNTVLLTKGKKKKLGSKFCHQINRGLSDNDDWT